MNIQKNLESRMIQLVNNVRKSYGLHSLQFCSGLCDIARKHSLDQLQSNRIFHVSPKTGTVQNRMDKHQYPYSLFGENVAMGEKMEVLHQKLLKSEGHFKNIVHRDFSHIGIGILANHKNRIFITQLFSKKAKIYSRTEFLNFVEGKFQNQRKRQRLSFVPISINEKLCKYAGSIDFSNQTSIDKAMNIAKQYSCKTIKMECYSITNPSSLNINYIGHPNLNRVLIGIDQTYNTNQILLMYLFR